MPLLPIQVQLLTLWTTARDRVVETARNAGDDRGELTGNVIFLVALAVAAAAVAVIVTTLIQNKANELP